MASNSDRRSGSSADSTRRTPNADVRRGDARSQIDPSQRRPRRDRRPKQGVGDEISRRKRAEREERLASRSRAWRTRTILAAVLIVAVLGGALALYDSQMFAVARVRVTGARHLTLSRVLALARVPADTTLLRLPAEAIRGRILADPWVADARVERKLPDTVQIDLTERVPVAAADIGDALWLTDAAGWVVERRSGDATVALPVVRDVLGLRPRVGGRLQSAAFANALAVIGGIGGQLRGDVRAVTAASVDQTALLTDEGVEILVGPARDLGKKDEIARKILAAQHGKVVFIDVRATDRPVSRGLGH